MSDQPSSQFPTQPAASPEDAPNVPADPLADTVVVPEGPSLLGADLPDVSEELRAYDTAHHVGLAALLDATPATWIHLPAYRIGRRLVTNGEYRAFLQATDPENPGARIYDSRALWEYVWQGLGLAVQGRRVPTRGPDGRVGSIEESYHESRTFVDAYLKSLRRSVERLIQGESLDAVPDGLNEEAKFRQSGEQTMMISVPASPLARGIFDAIDRAVDEGKPLDDGGNLAQRIGQLVRQLEPALRQSRDQRRPDVRPPEPEAMVLLRRAAEALQSGAPLTPSSIIFPREWSSPEGPKGLRFPGPRVAWEDQPVTGITLYEAAGYCAWLSLTTGKQVTLPSEAEWERAASWPFAPGEAPGDTAQKSLWPWWEASDGSGIKQDFTHFFGHLETGGMEGLYGDKREYRRIVDATTRRCGDDGTIEQLLGFGFQWTSDRFDHRA
jgi:formylglycine-generating enzyme required for sulfatase activity